MIIVEGPDGSGKSSLAQKLCIDLPAPIAPKAVSGEMNDIVDVQKYVDQHLDEGFRKLIFDRFALISEPIYSAAMRKIEPRAGWMDYRWLSQAHSRMRDVAPLVIICLPPIDEVWKNCQRDEFNKRLFPDKQRIAAVYWLYFNLAARNPAHIMYDYTKDNYTITRDFVAHALENRL